MLGYIVREPQVRHKARNHGNNSLQVGLNPNTLSRSSASCTPKNSAHYLAAGTSAESHHPVHKQSSGSHHKRQSATDCPLRRLRDSASVGRSKKTRLGPSRHAEQPETPSSSTYVRSWQNLVAVALGVLQAYVELRRTFSELQASLRG